MKLIVLASIGLFLYGLTCIAPVYIASVQHSHRVHAAQIERAIEEAK